MLLKNMILNEFIALNGQQGNISNYLVFASRNASKIFELNNLIM